MSRTPEVRAVEDRIELFEIGKDLDEHRLGLLLEVGRQLRAASSMDVAPDPTQYEPTESAHGAKASIPSFTEEIG